MTKRLFLLLLPHAHRKYLLLYYERQGIAEAAAVQFHNQFNAGSIRRFMARLTMIQESASETDFVALLEAVRRKLGTGKPVKFNWMECERNQ